MEAVPIGGMSERPDRVGYVWRQAPRYKTKALVKHWSVTRFDGSQRHMRPDRLETRVGGKKNKEVGQDRAGQHRAERAWISELVWVWVIE